MHPAVRLLPCLALAAALPAAAGDAALANARRAQALLGSGVWTRVIRITNQAPGRYPPTVDALVFELTGILWFYTDTDGTQSLSRYLNRADADKDNLSPLLAGIDPGFIAWTDAPAGDGGPAARALPNGCFIECLALLRRRLEAGAVTWDPRLLSFYVALPTGLRGHTVLQFRTEEGWVVIDPLYPRRRCRIRAAHPEDPRSCALALRPDIASARFLPLDHAFSLAVRSGWPTKKGCLSPLRSVCSSP